jgi:hypothetical protein
MDEILAVLMSWAVTLSGYPAPTGMPQVVPVDHAYFVKHACGGHECKVLGWYARGRTLYVDRRLDVRDSLYASSIVVHEMVHYLQHLDQERRMANAGNGAAICPSAIAMEREAYGVQREYLLRYGEYRPIGISMHSVGCESCVAAH